MLNFTSRSNTAHHDEKTAKMKFASVYPLYVSKVTKKGRTEEELLQVIIWLTGYSTKQILEFATSNNSFESFFRNAEIHPKANKITGVICGYRVEEIMNDLTRHVHYLDKLVDELAKGKTMEKILRS
jgi:hypothetical protein